MSDREIEYIKRKTNWRDKRFLAIFVIVILIFLIGTALNWNEIVALWDEILKPALDNLIGA